MGFGSHSRAINCEMCGQRFFPSSMKFHLKACVKKTASIEIPCPHCDKTFLRSQLERHVPKCGLLRGPLRNTSVKLHGISKPTTVKQVKFTEVAPSRVDLPPPPPPPSEYPTSVMEDGGGGASGGGLLPCAVCQRTFAPDRLAKHQPICRRSQQSKRKVFNTAEQRLSGFDSSERALASRIPQRRPMEMSKGGARGPPTPGRSERNCLNSPVAGGGFFAGSRASHSSNRRAPPPREQKQPFTRESSYIPCPSCSRTFAPDVAERHIPACRITINRPKPPPAHRGAIRSSSIGTTASLTSLHSPYYSMSDPPGPSGRPFPPKTAYSSTTYQGPGYSKVPMSASSKVAATAPASRRLNGLSKSISTDGFIRIRTSNDSNFQSGTMILK